MFRRIVVTKVTEEGELAKHANGRESDGNLRARFISHKHVQHLRSAAVSASIGFPPV